MYHKIFCIVWLCKQLFQAENWWWWLISETGSDLSDTTLEGPQKIIYDILSGKHRDVLGPLPIPSNDDEVCQVDIEKYGPDPEYVKLCPLDYEDDFDCNSYNSVGDNDDCNIHDEKMEADDEQSTSSESNDNDTRDESEEDSLPSDV